MFKTESSEGYKKIKQQLTVVLIWNMKGIIKKTPLIIGGSKKPHCLKLSCELPQH